MQVASLTYRLYKDKDLIEILVLWEKNSGWGGITEAEFYDWFINTPTGPCTIIVAENEEGEIIGQLVFRPTKILMRGKEVDGYRAMAPILNDCYRETDIKNYNHPIFAMFRFGIEQAANRQIDIIFSFPSIGWVAGVKTFPRYGLPKAEVSIFDCIGIDLKKTFALVVPEKNDWQVRVGKFSPVYETLWNKFVLNFPVNYAVSRSAIWHSWRRMDTLILEVYNRETAKLKGVFFIKKETNLMVDIIAETLEDAKQTLRLAACWIYQNHTDDNISELKLMHTPFAEQLVQGIPNYPVNFRFGFFCLSPQNKAVPPIKEWFIMPNE